MKMKEKDWMWWKLVYDWQMQIEDEEENWEKRKFEEQNELLNEMFGGHGWYITEQP